MSTRLDSFAARDLADVRTSCDVVVIGSGLAGLAAAVALAPRKVTLLTKTRLDRGGSSSWAQGGVAAALAAEDSPSSHAADTHEAGAGLCDPDVVDLLTVDGPRRILELIDAGARFDRDASGALKLGREGAHSHHRILHAGGDATGKEMVRALAEVVRRAEHVNVVEGTFASDLVLRDDRSDVVEGVLARDASGLTTWYRCAAVVLATGGFGQLYRHTTNPLAVTGDGLAMAARAGARLADLEFVQFHPTALAVDEDPLPLVTEALRGEGAILIDDDGERFMLTEHPRAELAPRDIVARAIWRKQQEGHTVRLDATDVLPGARFAERFPTVAAHCARHDLDPGLEPIPVTPAAHYAMAGVAVDADGRTSLPGLWACGETTSTGVHGANRLASNSLLEALVFGRRVADDLRDEHVRRVSDADAGIVLRETRPSTPAEPIDDPRATIRGLMWDRVSLARDREGLTEALREIDRAAASLPDAAPDETANLVTLARLVASAALARTESRGAHFRTDRPDSRYDLARRLHWVYRPQVGASPLVPVFDPNESSDVREIA